MNRLCQAAFLLLVLGMAAGCGQPELETRYASLAPGECDESVNGLGAWSELLQRRGHAVRRTTALTPTLFHRADCIVWFARDYNPPATPVDRWLDAWLSARPGRVLVVVLPDADMEWLYWRKVAARVPKHRQNAVRSEEAQAMARFARRRPRADKAILWPWFRFAPRLAQRRFPVRATTLQGRASWLQGVQGEQAEIYVCGVLLPRPAPIAERFVITDEEGEELTSTLADDNPPLPAELLWDTEAESVEQSVVLRCDQGILGLEQQRLDGRVLILANGSFLLNLGLVNRENRKLAAALADELDDCHAIYFLDARGPVTIREDVLFRYPGFAQLLSESPVSHLLGHLLLLAALVCCALWPQLGRPQQPASEETTDFGRHVGALAELLAAAKEGDRWARRRLEQYQQLREEIGTGVSSAVGTGAPRRGSSLLDSS